MALAKLILLIFGFLLHPLVFCQDTKLSFPSLVHYVEAYAESYANAKGGKLIWFDLHSENKLGDSYGLKDKKVITTIALNYGKNNPTLALQRHLKS